MTGSFGTTAKTLELSGKSREMIRNPGNQEEDSGFLRRRQEASSGKRHLRRLTG
jgi:hypothetical protein